MVQPRVRLTVLRVLERRLIHGDDSAQIKADTEPSCFLAAGLFGSHQLCQRSVLHIKAVENQTL